jgi:1-phosphatidylinositol phosphodiesterase
MASLLTVRNLTSSAISIRRVERFEDPNALQSKASGYFFSSKNVTPAAPTLPELSEHASSFHNQDLDITLQPLESYTISVSGASQDESSPSTTALRLTLETPGQERHRIDTNPSYTQKSTKVLTSLSHNPSTTYQALFHPSHPNPHLAIHTNHLQDYTSWMTGLPDTLPLSAISIPGTHNSHTYYRALPSVRCQTHDIATQLENGIRFLDIRVQAVDASKKDLYLVHGAFPVSLTGPKYFAPVLQICLDFLAAHPGETILLSLKREGIGSLTDEHLARILWEHYISGEQEKWYTDTGISYLRDVRGKLVLVRRYNTPKDLSPQHDMKMGLDATAWPHNTSHAIFPTPPSSSTATKATFSLQDFCEVLVPDIIPTKLSHCNAHFLRTASAQHPIPGYTTDTRHPVPPAPLSLNFLSASNFWKRTCWPSNIAKVVNRGMEEWVCGGHGLLEGEAEGGGQGVRRRRGQGDASTGVVVMDCVGEGGDWEFVRVIVGMNMGVLMRCRTS